MNEQLQGKLVEILTGIQGAVKAGADFALEQLPDIAQQYVLYGRVQTLLSVLMLLCSAAVGAWLLSRVVRAVKAAGDLFETNPAIVVPAVVGAFVLLLIPAVELHGAILRCALVWFAPKVWLLKELAGLLK